MNITKKDLELIKKAKAKYQKEWRKKNRDEEREYHFRYWLKKAQEFKVNQIDEN